MSISLSTHRVIQKLMLYQAKKVLIYSLVMMSGDCSFSFDLLPHTSKKKIIDFELDLNGT